MNGDQLYSKLHAQLSRIEERLGNHKEASAEKHQENLKKFDSIFSSLNRLNGVPWQIKTMWGVIIVIIGIIVRYIAYGS